MGIWASSLIADFENSDVAFLFEVKYLTTSLGYLGSYWSNLSHCSRWRFLRRVISSLNFAMVFWRKNVWALYRCSVSSKLPINLAMCESPKRSNPKLIIACLARAVALSCSICGVMSDFPSSLFEASFLLKS